MKKVIWPCAELNRERLVTGYGHAIANVHSGQPGLEIMLALCRAARQDFWMKLIQVTDVDPFGISDMQTRTRCLWMMVIDASVAFIDCVNGPKESQHNAVC